MLLWRFLCVEIGYVAFIADSQVAILVKFIARSQSSPASFANMDDDDEGVWLILEVQINECISNYDTRATRCSAPRLYILPVLRFNLEHVVGAVQ